MRSVAHARDQCGLSNERCSRPPMYGWRRLRRRFVALGGS